MHLPSYFFHVKVDLTEPSPSLTQVSDANQGLVRYRHSNSKKSEISQTVNQSNQAGTAASRSLYKNTSKHNGEASKGGETWDRTVQDAIDLQKSDWRWGRILMWSVDMSREDKQRKKAAPSKDGHKIITANSGGLATKGKLETLDYGDDEIGWGVVRLYRDADETPGLYDDVVHHHKTSKHASASQDGSGAGDQTGGPSSFRDEDCTMLCILAVPSYLTPSDFLGFVGEKTREEVSHFRMIRTERSNRYMVLMKFRSGRRAREWRKEWNGKVFNDMEVSFLRTEGWLRRYLSGIQAENCHVVFVKSVEFREIESSDSEGSFPDMSHDPFTPSKTIPQPSASTPSAAFTTKPIPPPTPSLVELPTCPVCLERMDESTGLLTILCQHVFHCTCLQKWRGGGCPVCRFTQQPTNPKRYSQTHDEGHDGQVLNECSICHTDANLWICLICGSVGCGRYDAAHAFLHHKQTGHCFAMDLTTQRVWDYGSDGYVHRIMQDKSDGKLMELPSATGDYDNGYGSRGPEEGETEYVPREKMEAMGMEYTALLTGQLESQRTYFEGRLEEAADKASWANQTAFEATEASSRAVAELTELQSRFGALADETLPNVTKERDRAVQKASRFEEMSRKLEKQWREESTVSRSLMERIKFLDAEITRLKESNQQLEEGKKDLEEQNRDLTFFISGSQKLKELEMGEEVTEGTVSVPEEKRAGKKRKGKSKGKGKGKADQEGREGDVKDENTCEEKDAKEHKTDAGEASSKVSQT